MGYWSVDVLGGDTPMDILGEIGSRIGVANLYPLRFTPMQAANVRAKVEPRQTELLAVLTGADFLLRFSDNGEPRDTVPVLAAVLLASGAEFDPMVRAAAIRAAEQNAEKADEWGSAGERRAAMLAFAQKIRDHRAGTITDIAHKGLFATMAEKLGG